MAPPVLVDTEERWYCVRTSFHGEIRTDLDIRDLGFSVFAPSLWRPPARARRDRNGVLRPARPARLVPLFPRYLFVKFRRDLDHWHSIARLETVDCIFGSTPLRPTPVPDKAIDLIRGLCAPNDCVYPDNRRMTEGYAPAIPRAPIEAGTRTRLMSGPMADLSGICTWSDGKRVRLLLEIMGRPVSVTVAQAAVEIDT